MCVCAGEDPRVNVCGGVQLPHTQQREGSWMGEGSCLRRRRVPPPVSKTHVGVSGSTTGQLKQEGEKERRMVCGHVL